MKGLDVVAYWKARCAEPYAKPPARMVGGDMPKWDADVDKWCDDALTVKENKFYKNASMGDEVKGEIG